MRLKKLELFGFKSFADRTEINFDEGVTCVVGPNGCGKSNVSDSIRWVLGERSAKMLRGSKMEDVIFNGTDFRKPLAMAEVSLTIDNSDRGLPIDYNEVTLTRRLYRSGESEYLINKTVCRLKDIQDLILDTGIGSNSYSMIEQGRIDYILNADAEERRFLIEEAAGISKYKVKKEEAIRKLEKTEENRLRLNDIIQEVHRNIQYAERQARRAEKYREEFEKLKRLEIRRAFQELSQTASQLSALQAESETLAANLDRNEEEIQEYRRLQEELSASVRRIIDEYRDAESTRYQIQSQIDQNTQSIKFNQEKRLEIANREGQLAQEKIQIQENRAKNKAEIAAKEREIFSLGEEKKLAGVLFSESQEKLREIESVLEEIKKSLDRVRNESFQAASDTTRLRNDFHRLSSTIESVIEQKKRRAVSFERLLDEKNNLQIKKEECEKTLGRVKDQALALGFQKRDLDERLQNSQLLAAKLKSDIDEFSRKLHEKQTRYAMLGEIDSQSQQEESELLSSDILIEQGLACKLRDVLRVQTGYEWALEAALDSFARSLVVRDRAAARILMEKIQSTKSLPFGLWISEPVFCEPIPQEENPVPAHNKIRFSVLDIVEIKEGFAQLFQAFFRNTYILESVTYDELLEEILPLTGATRRFISPDGILAGPHSKIYFRNLSMTSETNLFKRGTELQSLSAEIVDMELQLNGVRSEFSQAEEELLSLTNLRQNIEAQRQETALQNEAQEAVFRNLDERLNALSHEIELIEMESRELESNLETAKQQKDEIEITFQKAEERERILHDQFDHCRREIESADQKKSTALHDYAEAKARLTHLEERGRLIQESLSILADHDSRNQKRLETVDQESLSLKDRLEQLKMNDEELEQNQILLLENRRAADLALEKVRLEKDQAEAKLSEAQSALQSLLQNHEQLQSARHHIEMKTMDLGYQERNIHERLEQAYRIQLSELKKEDFWDASRPESEPESDLNETITDLKRKVESLGTVNLLAIEEYEELKKRYDFLMTQQKDLDEAREQLLETIRKINRTTKGLFEETFANVQKCFQEYYDLLFRGGHAQLVLVDESNPLESGIDIVVRPPGKKPQHISLLSGGEKALTAIALLFALFKIKPSPFCVLDEVDAPLDEANVDRFLGVLRSFLELSQFIIITHNRKTIAMGDSLYGVTMQEAGVSKLVSVKVNTKDLPPAEPSLNVAAKPPAEDAAEETIQA